MSRVRVYWEGGAWYHIKAFIPTPLPHQRKIITEGILGQYALGILGRALHFLDYSQYSCIESCKRLWRELVTIIYTRLHKILTASVWMGCVAKRRLHTNEVKWLSCNLRQKSKSSEQTREWERMLKRWKPTGHIPWRKRLKRNVKVVRGL